MKELHDCQNERPSQRNLRWPNLDKDIEEAAKASVMCFIIQTEPGREYTWTMQGPSRD